MIQQSEIQLPAFRRGFHLITHIIENETHSLPEKGMLNIFIKHTSAGLTINENADPSAHHDLDTFLDHLIPEGHSLYTHTSEGKILLLLKSSTTSPT